MLLSRLLCLLFLAGETAAFVPTGTRLVRPSLVSQRFSQPALQNDDDVPSFDPIGLSSEATTTSKPAAAWAAPVLAVLFLSLPAEAATGGAFPSAIAAYVHYASILILAGCLAIERFTVKPNMSQDDWGLISAADIGLGVFGTTLAASGYFRVVDYGKGWDFYSHEPVFWVKMIFTAIFGALSFFPTTKVIQAAFYKNEHGQYPEMSEELAKRMTTVMNAEITALLSIPLTATLMSRGIGYNEGIPWPAEAFVAALALFGAGYIYIKDALSYEYKLPAAAPTED